MKKSKILRRLIVLFAVGAVATACGQKEEKSTAITDNSTQQRQSKSTRQFIDSAGREVTIPETITKIAPSGSLSQIVLYTSYPDLLVGLASPFSEEAKPFINQKYWELPEFGQFYGKNASLNMETLSAAAPDVVIDIGEPKKTVKEDMDNLQSQLDIPVIFIEANLEGMASAYEKLGELMDNKLVEPLADYSQKVIDQAGSVKSLISEEQQKSVYLASGTAGLDTNAEGSFHAQVIETIGAKNAATGIEAASSGSGTTVSMEQIMQWQPDYIITENPDVYDLILSDSTWANLKAVKEKKVYKIPTAPYNFMGFPPSVNRLMGIQWLGNLVYPEQYQLDIAQVTRDFYQLFYHSDVTIEQVNEVLKNAS